MTPTCSDRREELKKKKNWFDPAVGEGNHRFVPYNGGLGAAQLHWLRGELR